MGSQRVLLGPLAGRDPDRIGSFVLLGRLGAGSMGRVYLGRSAAGRLVAVKTIKPEYAEEADFRARFAQEVAAAKRVSGVFTAAVVAADADAHVPWLATAYVPAPSLDHLVETCGPLPVPAVRWLAAGCAEALESIHDAGLVHRDLKPSNVLVSPDGPRVIDFGVARAVERIQLTSTHGAVGTPAYMAPEQARDTRRAIVASDVFSLGSTLLYAASGHAPYRGETVMDILVQLATEPPDLSGLPRDLTGMVAACLDRDPRHRPSPAELLAALEPYVDLDAGHEFGPSVLPEAGLALIQEYRQRPQPAPRVEADPLGPDATFSSQPGSLRSDPSTGSLGSVPGRPGARLARRLAVPSWLALRRPAQPAGWSSSPGFGRPRVGGWRGGGIRSAVVPVGAVVALLLLGGLLGAWISGRGSQPMSPAAQTGSGGQLDPSHGDPPAPPGNDGGPPGGSPTLAVNQPIGDGDTTFVVYGRDWPPRLGVVLMLNGLRLPQLPRTDDRGAFNYALNQGRLLFRGRLPAGQYVVAAQGPDGRLLEGRFNVRP